MMDDYDRLVRLALFAVFSGLVFGLVPPRAGEDLAVLGVTSATGGASLTPSSTTSAAAGMARPTPTPPGKSLILGQGEVGQVICNGRTAAGKQVIDGKTYMNVACAAFRQPRVSKTSPTPTLRVSTSSATISPTSTPH